MVRCRKHAEMAWPLQASSGSENEGLCRGSGGVPLTAMSPGRRVLSGAHFKVCTFVPLMSFCLFTFRPFLLCIFCLILNFVINNINI